jgi:hypothetical protein
MDGSTVPPIPCVQYHLASTYSPQYRWITVGDDKIHFISDLNEFYSALGYTEEVRRATKWLPEEFIWFEYTKDNCKKSAAQLQAKLIEYLAARSETFRERYSIQYTEWLKALAR